MAAISMISTPGYCELRATELVHEAQLAVTSDLYNEHYDQCITKAIQLLTIARMARIREHDETKDGADRR